MMVTKTMQLSLAALLMTAPLLATAGGQHDGGHGHGQSNGDDMDMGSMNMMNMDMSAMKKVPTSMDDMPGGAGMHDGHDMGGHDMGGHDMGGHGMGGHAHDSWVDAPVAFQGKRFDQWENFDRASKGMVLYRDNCAACHGIDGRGTGPLAKSLKHPPADLTNHFHQADGSSDAYLFWRVSEGGTAEPFASMDSAMPAFKGQLSEADRWNVLSYVHQAFHRELLADAAMPGDMMKGQGSGHGSGHH